MKLADPIRPLVVPLVSLVLVLYSRLASAQGAAQERPAERTLLGKPGTLVIDRVVGLSSDGRGSLFQAGIVTFRHGRQKVYANETTTTQVGIRPSFDVFVSNRLTLGGDLGFDYTWRSSTAGTLGGLGAESPSSGFTVTFAPRIGYYVPIGDALAIWPRAAVGVEAGQRTSDVRLPGVESNEAFVRLHATLDVDLVVPITPRLAFLAGPRAVGVLGGPRNLETASVEVAAKGSLALAF